MGKSVPILTTVQSTDSRSRVEVAWECVSLRLWLDVVAGRRGVRGVPQTIATALPQRVRRDHAPATRPEAPARAHPDSEAVSGAVDVIGMIAAIGVDGSRSRSAHADVAPLAGPDATAANDCARR